MIIDAHCHLGRSPGFHFPDVSVPTMLQVMNSLQIDKVICSHLALLGGHLDYGYEESVRAHAESSGRVLLYTVFHPGLERGIDFVKTCERGLVRMSD